MFGALKANLRVNEYLWVTLIATHDHHKQRDLRLCEDLSKNENLGEKKLRGKLRNFLVFANNVNLD